MGPYPAPAVNPRRELSVPSQAWQEWQGSAFARVRWRSLARTKILQTRGLSERARTRPNIARTCHAEGRGFESHHPLSLGAFFVYHLRHRQKGPGENDV